MYLFEKIKTTYIKEFGKITGIFIISSITLFLFSPALLEFLTAEESALAGVAMVFIYIGLMGEYLISIRWSIPTSYNIYPCQSAANKDLIDFIFLNKPKSCDMIEYSSKNVADILIGLKKIGANIRLLIHDPRSSISERQKKKICGQIIDLIQDFENYQNINIKFYNNNASLRGRRFDDQLINIGWYTYDKRNKDFPLPQISGHTNPLITIRSDSKGYEEFKRMFDDVFSDYWESGTVLSEVCGDCEEAKKCFGNDYIDMLKDLK